MNERIVEIASQAGYDPEVFALCRVGMEKFAELIVKECANLCQSEWDGDADTYDSCEAYNECADMIREHFGVK
jgi:formylmethanofuran dehydrogenase subunit B